MPKLNESIKFDKQTFDERQLKEAKKFKEQQERAREEMGNVVIGQCFPCRSCGARFEGCIVTCPNCGMKQLTRHERKCMSYAALYGCGPVTLNHLIQTPKIDPAVMLEKFDHQMEEAFNRFKEAYNG